VSELFAHQREAISFLVKRRAAMLTLEMGLGKTRCALKATEALYVAGSIDRMLVLAPAAVRFSWRQEIDKLDAGSFLPCVYDPKKAQVYGAGKREGRPLPVLIVSYALLPQKKHVEALQRWCSAGKTALVADESSFLKNRAAKQTRGAKLLSRASRYCWLLTGTPIANSPLDLYAQADVMCDGVREGPLRGMSNWWQFRARYGVLQTMHIGRKSFQHVVGYQNLPELTKRFAPYVLRREKKDCLDLPDKTYEVREVALTEATWHIYQELKREAMLALPDTDATPEPNAAVRLLRLAQITSGHVGHPEMDAGTQEPSGGVRDVSSEKLSWLVSEILDGELSNERTLIVWCRWRRERERLAAMLKGSGLSILQIYGGQIEKDRNNTISYFDGGTLRRVLLAQPHAGGFGLNLTSASTAIFLSNDFSYTTRVQAEDRIHRIGQYHPCLYLDVLATGPNGEKTIDHHIVDALRAKKNVAEMTCNEWKQVLA